MSEADLQPEAKAAGIGVEILSRRMGGVLTCLIHNAVDCLVAFLFSAVPLVL